MTPRLPFGALLLALSLSALAPALAPARADEDAGAGDPLILLSTTSTENSGLLAHLLPLFEAQSGIEVRAVAVGTGQALRAAARGDGDVLLTHDRTAEERFVAEGHGTGRRDVMYNDFVLVGPAGDPAGIAALDEAPAALAAIAARGAPFASRGDESGTHRAEMRLWAEASVDPLPASGTWYREMGQGMGAVLNAAVAMDAYALTDRATWAAFGNKRGHRILLEGDPRLFNPYGVVPVDPARHPGVNADAAEAFASWITGPAGQAAIASFEVDGQRLFVPNAGS
ncbi:tungstate transport system substrate-binding protein [Hasllibacter halocynthiae]|uniref:Tungstate transport system substrate-binding protein n=1 Tax=Hasllibacter halocynthiae TaxID=595589 RepID=A0A2T0X324_9RHOB|nr:substrate-binding domain-containing protein [Hasllibacter halocynthiae]PRY93264.1 tungstate transport system substrate-binding protein [Hasllibacter halocynthiae]